MDEVERKVLLDVKKGKHLSRAVRFIGLVIVFVSGMIFTSWLIELLGNTTALIWPYDDGNTAMPYIIFGIAIVLFSGIFMILKAEWDMLNREAEELLLLKGDLKELIGEVDKEEP